MSEGGEVIHLDLVGRSVDEAAPAPDPKPEDPNQEPPEQEGGGPKRPKRRDDGLPADCPVQALGVFGDTYAFLDELQQYMEFASKHLARSQLLGLVGRRPEWLYEHYPRTDKDGNVTGWRPERFQQDLMRACARRGIWDASERVRGAGCWRGEDGELIWHCGDAIFTIDLEGAWRDFRPGVVQGGVYPAFGALPRPELLPADDAVAGVKEVLSDLSTWQWRRGKRDAFLLLGWMAAAHIGGALKWRASCWLTGGAGAGKSSLQDYNRGLFGSSALVTAESASPAGIWQTLGRRTLPCSFDEQEPDQDNPKRMAGMIELARIAASGGKVRRGGNEHTPVMFVLRSAFMFSSILIPPMSQADRQRLAVLELDPLPKGGMPPDFKPARLRQLGACIRARIAAAWPTLDERIEMMRQGLIARGHSARGADQFGVLLACADALLHDAMPDGDSFDELLDGYALEELVEVAGDASGPERCLAHLLSSIIDPYRSGGRKTVGEWVQQAVKNTSSLDRDYEEGEQARKALMTHGMRVVIEEGKAKWLAIANSHQALTLIYKDTHWAARSGADGGWKQEFRRIDGHFVHPQPLRFAGMVSRGVLLPLDMVLGGEACEL